MTGHHPSQSLPNPWVVGGWRVTAAHVCIPDGLAAPSNGHRGHPLDQRGDKSDQIFGGAGYRAPIRVDEACNVFLVGLPGGSS